MDSPVDDCGLHSRVSPFRDLRIIGYVLLPEAFRSLSRLSSALSAKASALRPSLLDLARPSLPFREGRLPPVRASVRGGRLHVFTCFFSSVQALRLPGPELAFVLGESVCSYRIRTFRILDVVFSWNLIKKTFTVCSFQGT